jgi:hypothetical protein
MLPMVSGGAMRARPKTANARNRSRELRSIRSAIISEWVGSWVAKPKDDRDRKAAKLAREAMRFTPRGSLISPVAVAVVDILGVKALLRDRPLEELARRVAEPFYNLDGPAYRWGQGPLTARQLERRGFRRMAGIYPAMISDTIILATRPDWELGDPAIADAHAVIRLAEYVCRVIRINSLYDIPLRAAISFGDSVIGVGGHPALLGEPTREASEWERRQDWVGGMLTPSAVATLRAGAEEAKRINEADFAPQYPNVLVEYPIPLKDGSPALAGPKIALNWAHGVIPRAMFVTKVPSVPAQGEATPDVLLKLTNTAKFEEYCRDRGLYTIIEWD